MRLVSQELQQAVRACLTDYQRTHHPLPGIGSRTNFESFLAQVFDSIRRVEYVFVLQTRGISPERENPTSTIFDPYMAAILQSRAGNFDEACWLVFIATHFGKHLRHGWRLARSIYGSSGVGPRWDWKRIKSNTNSFINWLSVNQSNIMGSFGNHRKYVTLDPHYHAGTGAAFVSYVGWVQSHSSHAQLLHTLMQQSGGDRGLLFDALYTSMRNVKSFGRTARFDYLTMLGKLNLFPIEPHSPYIQSSTGPRRGATLLLSGSSSMKVATKVLESELRRLGTCLASVGVKFSMQVLEDSICNWQKSPARYIRFRG